MDETKRLHALVWWKYNLYKTNMERVKDIAKATGESLINYETFTKSYFTEEEIDLIASEENIGSLMHSLDDDRRGFVAQQLVASGRI